MSRKKDGRGKVALPQDTFERGSKLTFRKRWPSDIVRKHPELKNRPFQRALGTSDPQAARPLAESANRDFLRQCDAYRTSKPPESSEAWLRSLTAEQRGQLVAIADALTAKTFGPAEDAEEAESRLSVEFFQSEWALAHPPPLTPLLAATLPPDSQARIRDAIRTEVLRTTGGAATALLGLGYPPHDLPPNVRDGASASTENAKAALPITGAKLLELWAAESKPSPATTKKYAGIFRRISQSLGFDDVRRIAAEDVTRFKSARLAQNISPGTVQDDVLGAGAVCSWAVKNRLLAGNPFAGLAPRASRQGPESRAPYDDAEAALILKAARGESGWLRWLPWVLCFTGARINEIVELKRGNVRQEDGVWFFDIKPNERRQGKNATFQRMLPMHPALEAEGFLDYVTTLPVDPTEPLFPSIPPDPAGSRISPATTRHGEWVRDKVGIKAPSKAPAHSWRHRMEDELRKARVPDEVVDAITGRNNPRNAGAGYGKGYRRMPGEVRKELAKVPSPVPPLPFVTA